MMEGTRRSTLSGCAASLKNEGMKWEMIFSSALPNKFREKMIRGE